MLGRVQTRVAVILQEFEKVISLDEIQLAGLQGFGGEFVRLSRNRRMKSENFACLCDAKDKCLAVP